MVIIGYNFLYAQEVLVSDTLYKEITNETFLPLFKALKDGDVSTIKQYISGDMYNKSKILLEQNKDYPQFLRDFYHGARFWVKKIVKINGDIIADVVIEFPNGDQGLVKLCLQKEMVNLQGNNRREIWRVVKEVKDWYYFRPENTSTKIK